MGTAYSVDVSGNNLEVDIIPATPFCAPMLCLRGAFGTIQIFIANEQLADIENVIRAHRDPEQAINQKNQSEEEIA